MSVPDDVVTFEIDGNDALSRAPAEAGTYTYIARCADGSEATGDLQVKPLAFEFVDEAVESATEPAGREYFSWWIDDVERALYVYGGFVYEPRQFTPNFDLFKFDLASSTWSSARLEGEALPAPGHRVAHQDRDVVWAFGGASLDANGLQTPPAVGTFERGDDGLRFSEADATGAPGSYTGFVFWDPQAQALTSVCGVDTTELGLHCKMHQQQQGGWIEIDVEGEVPPGRLGFHAAYDEKHHRVVVYGGQVGTGSSDVAGDTWSLSLSGTPRWTQLAAGEEVTRRNGGYVYDPVNNTMVVWGGTPDGSTSSPGLDVLTLDEGTETWHHFDDFDFDPRASGQGVFDPSTNSVLWGFGNSRAGPFTDLWRMSVVPQP